MRLAARLFPLLPLFVGGFMDCSAVAQACNPNDPVTAMYDLGAGTYKTFEGGLYENGSNLRPAAHETAGVALADSIVPLDAAGTPSLNGRIVLISIGFSNMTQEWRAGAVGDPASQSLTFTAKANARQPSGYVNPKVLIVDGAQGGQTAGAWAATPPNLQTAPWSTPMTRLQQAGSSRFQVQIACVKTAHSGPNTCIAADGATLGDAGSLANDFAAIARNLKTVFPNIKLTYFLPRIYGGYALTPTNPEPYAYECGFAIKWMIESQIHSTGEFGNLSFDAKTGVSPWLAWGPYIWAHGVNPNGLGINWLVSDFRPDDQTHPAAGAIDKVGNALLDFFLNDSTTQPWFGSPCAAGDIDCDGSVSVTDLLAVINNWGPCPPPAPGNCRSDIAPPGGNGIVNVSDLLMVINHWN